MRIKRRAALQRLVAALLMAAPLSAIALSSLWQATQPSSEPLSFQAADYRGDGGQHLTGKGLSPNALTLLNQGRKIDLCGIEAHLLASLPGFGEKSALKASAEGRISGRQRTASKGLIKEPCTLNSH